jgi:Kef-type K+ transport system membrane component KefB
MRFLKVVLIAVCLFLGVLFAYQGLGTDFRILNFESMDQYGIPVGIALIVLGMLISRYWTVPE